MVLSYVRPAFLNLTRPNLREKTFLINHLESALGSQFQKHQIKVLIYKNYYCRDCGGN